MTYILKTPNGNTIHFSGDIPRQDEKVWLEDKLVIVTDVLWTYQDGVLSPIVLTSPLYTGDKAWNRCEYAVRSLENG